MHRYLTLILSCIVCLDLTCRPAAAMEDGSAEVVPDPTPSAEIRHLNPDVPDYDPPKYRGKRYSALVPYTLDLAERARLSVA